LHKIISQKKGVTFTATKDQEEKERRAVIGYLFLSMTLLYLLLLSLVQFCACSTITLHPTVIPLNSSQPDVENANRGYYKWIEQTLIPAPSYPFFLLLFIY
jgi:hypothetical protein